MTSNSSRVSSLVEATIGHADHNVSDAHKAFMLDYIRDNTIAPAQGEGPVFFKFSAVQLPADLADLDNGIWGPIEGDDPVPSSECWWVQRGARPGLSRMCARPTRPTRDFTFMGLRFQDKEDGTVLLQIFTAYGGKCAPREVTDPNCPAEAIEEACQFWPLHALCGVRPA